MKKNWVLYGIVIALLVLLGWWVLQQGQVLEAPNSSITLVQDAPMHFWDSILEGITHPEIFFYKLHLIPACWAGCWQNGPGVGEIYGDFLPLFVGCSPIFLAFVCAQLFGQSPTNHWVDFVYGRRNWTVLRKSADITANPIFLVGGFAG